MAPMGNSAGRSFASAAYDDEDKEADAVWEAIDKRMDSRRKVRREARLQKEDIENYRASNPKLSEQFANLKRKLHALSTEEWDSIQEIRDSSLRIKKKRFITSDEGRGTILSLKVDRLSDSVSGLKITSDAEAVIARGVEAIPNSVKLWMQAAEVANEEDARLLLRRAVECCPLHVELWLALAGLETYANAKRVLNRARKKLCKEPAIWIAAAKLEEANGKTGMVGRIIERGIRALQREGLEIDREMWMKEAEAAERAGSVATRRAIITTLWRLG